MEPSQFLGRVLRREADVSALLAYLAALDPEPLQEHLGLSKSITDVRVEVQHTRASRMDVVLDGDAGPIAVLEIKVEAAEHGDQLQRYEQFAAEWGAEIVLADLELPSTVVPPGWRRAGLSEIFACWKASNDRTAQALGPAAAQVFEQWEQDAAGPLSRMSSAMYPVVLRQTRDALIRKGYVAYAGGTSGGQPSLTVFTEHPGGYERAYLCVDLRCQDKNNGARDWLFRVGVQVDAGEDLAADRRLAHQLAIALRPGLGHEPLSAALLAAGCSEVARAIRGNRPLKTPRQPDAISRWLETVDRAGNSQVGKHPIFYADWGRRLAAQFLLNPKLVTATELPPLIAATLAYLSTVAASSPGRR